MDRETITTGVATITDGLHQAALYLDDVPTTGLVVGAIVLAKVTGTDNSRQAPSWIIASSLLLLLAYLGHQYVTIEPYDAGAFIVIGIRGLAVFYLYRSIAGLVEFVLSDAKDWRLEKYCTIGGWLSGANQWRKNRRDERDAKRRRQELEANSPVPLTYEEAFDLAMQKVQDDFARACDAVYASALLEKWEKESVVEQLRAKATKRMNKIMLGKKS